MFRVIGPDGETKELPEVRRSRILNGRLFCIGKKGRVVRIYEPGEILAFGDGGILEKLEKFDSKRDL